MWLYVGSETEMLLVGVVIRRGGNGEVVVRGGHTDVWKQGMVVRGDQTERWKRRGFDRGGMECCMNG